MSHPITAGSIAAEAGVPVWRIQYILRTRGIQAAARVGTFRLFTESDRQYVLSVLKHIAAEREGAIPHA